MRFNELLTVVVSKFNRFFCFHHLHIKSVAVYWIISIMFYMCGGNVMRFSRSRVFVSCVGCMCKCKLILYGPLHSQGKKPTKIKLGGINLIWSEWSPRGATIFRNMEINDNIHEMLKCLECWWYSIDLFPK